MAEGKKAKKQGNRGFKNVAALVRARLEKDIDYSYGRLLKEVKALRPKSKFNEGQYAWYRSALKNNRLKGI